MRTVAALLLLSTALAADDWPQWGGRPDRNMVSGETGLPESWPRGGGPVLRWSVPLGTETHGSPVVAGGRVFIGTNNGAPRDPAVVGDKGVLLCLAEDDGRLLWQAVHDKLPSGDAEDYHGVGICSTPAVDGERVYYVSNRGELVCADVRGFADGENDGPFTGEARTGPADADLVWVLDFRAALGVTPHQASASSPLVVGGLVFVHTGQGADYSTGKVKNPAAPSFVAVDKSTGKVVWQDASPGAGLWSGQWSSPSYGPLDGVGRVYFPGGDGRLYAFEASTGRKLWVFDGAGHEGRDADGRPESGNHFVATPVLAGETLVLASGQDPEGGGKPGCLRAIDVRSGKERWRLAEPDFKASIATAAVHEGLVYAMDLAGTLLCVELETGRPVWTHDLPSVSWASPLVADGRIYVPTMDAEVLVFRAGREMKVLSKNPLPGVRGVTCVAANGTLFVAGAKRLYALGRRT